MRRPPCQQSKDFNCSLEERKEVDLIMRPLHWESEHPELPQCLPCERLFFQAQPCVPASLNSWTQTCFLGLIGPALIGLIGPEHLVGPGGVAGRKILDPRGLACSPYPHLLASMGPSKEKRSQSWRPWMESEPGWAGTLSQRPVKSGHEDIYIAL